MIKTLQCPSCGGPLEYDPESESDTIRCPFCHNTAVLPARQKHVRISFDRASKGSHSAATAVLVVVAIVLLVGGGIVFAIINLVGRAASDVTRSRSEEHTSELQSPSNLV